MARWLTAALVTLCVPIASCGVSFPSSSSYVVGPDVAVQTVPVPPGNFFGLAWLRDGTIVVGHTVDLHPWIGSTQLWQLQPDGSGLARIPLPSDPACRVTEYLFPTSFPDGRVGLLKRCDDQKGAPPSDPADDYAVAYSLKTRQLEVLTPSLNHYPGAISWNPSLDHAVAGQGSGIVGSVFEIEREGTKLLHVPIRDGDRVFWLDDYFRSQSEDDAQVAREGRAEAPAWSPDGRTIAFLAEARSIGRSGFDRLDIPFDMYLMSPDGGHLRKVLSDIDGGGPSWSPDSRYIAFGRQGGVWLYRLGSDHAVRIASESFGNLAWSPDGRSIAGIRWLHDDADQYEIVILDVGGVVAPTQSSST